METDNLSKEGQVTLIWQIMKYALPLCVTSLLQFAAPFCITIMLGRAGKTELATLAIANTCYITFSAFFGACFYAIGILISKQHVNGNKVAVSEIIWNGLWLSCILGSIATLILWNGDKILLLFNQSPELVIHTVKYFHYIALTMTLQLIGAMISQIYTGMGKPFIGTAISLIRLPITLYLSFKFILGSYNLGLTGVSLAFLIAQIITLTIAMVYIRFSVVWQYICLPNVKRWNWQQIKHIFSVEIHIGLQFLGELSAMSIATFLMGYLGVTALASSQVVAQYSMILVMLIIGVSQAISIRVSEAYGKKQYHLIDKYTNGGFLIILGIAVVFALLYLLFPLYLIGVFVNVYDLHNVELVHLISWFMFLAIPTLLIDGIRNVLTGSFRGLQNSKVPMLIGTGCLWFIGLPASYIIGILFHGGPVLFRVGFGLGFLSAAIILWFYFQRYKARFLIIK